MRCKVNSYFELSASPVATPTMSLPVSSANVASVVCRNATAVDYYSEEYEAYASDDLHYTEDEFNLLN